MKDAAGPSSGTAKRGSLQLVSDYLGETYVQYPSTPMTAGRAGLAHKCPTHPRRNTQLGSSTPRAQSCTSPITAPTLQKHRGVHTKSVTLGEHKLLHAVQLCKTTFVAVINFHKVASMGLFSFSPPPPTQHFTMNLIS